MTNHILVNYITIVVPANPDADDCLQAAVDTFTAANPDYAGWDLMPRWADDDREAVELTIPV